MIVHDMDFFKQLTIKKKQKEIYYIYGLEQV